MRSGDVGLRHRHRVLKSFHITNFSSSNSSLTLESPSLDEQTLSQPSSMLVSLTVGKVDAGVTVLLTPDKRLIEFPSILLPPDISSGSIVDITVGRNAASEEATERRFRALQDQIYASFGAAAPSAPILRCRNATQTSVVLEWDPIQLATADLISLSLYRNGQKAGNIPRPLSMHSTKISGLAVDTEYTFHLVLRTTAGTFTSERVPVRTHKMTDLSGVTITTGILPPATRENLTTAVERIGAKIVEGVRIDTTHFVTTEGRGVQWEKAVEQNIPVVRPEWVDACEQGGRILGVTKFYLDAQWSGPPVEGRPSTATQQPAVTQKELPSTPTQNGSSARKSKDEEDKSDQAYKVVDEGSKAEDSDDDEDDDDDDSKADEQDKSAVQEEQKVSIDDREKQKVALRPAASREQVQDSEEDDDSRAASPDEKTVTPGDNASFQDVAL